MARRWLILVALALATPVLAQSPTTAPAIVLSAPAMTEWTALVRQLNAADPAARADAREKLMLLTRDDLPALADAVRESGALEPSQRSLLREIVEHVFLTGEHRFRGVGTGYIGISQPARVIQDAPAGVIVQSRILGYDSYRALQPGDVIIGLSAVNKDATGPQQATGLEALRALLRESKPGNWILVRLLRDGVERDTALRLGPTPPVGADRLPVIHFDAAATYWTKTFLPRLQSAAATRPVG